MASKKYILEFKLYDGTTRRVPFEIPLPEKGVDYFDGEPGKTPEKGVDYWTPEELLQMISDVLASEEITKIQRDIQSIRDDMNYKPISISSFTNNLGTQEIGTVLTEVTLNWALNKEPAELTLDNAAIDKALRTITLTRRIDIDISFTLTATDERGATASKTTGIVFYNGVYYGAAENPESIDSAFVLGLQKTLTGTRKRTFSANAGAGQYIWYCLPAHLGACAFKVGGFEGGFDLVDTIDFVNAKGYTSPYYIYRSSNAALGNTTVEVS